MLRRILSVVALALLALAVVGVGLLSFRGPKPVTRATSVNLPQGVPQAGAVAPTPTPDTSPNPNPVPPPVVDVGAWQPARSPAPLAAFVLVGFAVMAAIAAFTSTRIFEQPAPPPGVEPAAGQKRKTPPWLLLAGGAAGLVIVAVCLLALATNFVFLSPAAMSPFELTRLALNETNSAPTSSVATEAPAIYSDTPSPTSSMAETPVGGFVTPSPTSSIAETPEGPSTFTNTPEPTPTSGVTQVGPLDTATPTPGPTLEEQVVVEAEWPQHMDVSDSGQVRISLIRTAPGTYQVTVESPGNVATSFVVTGVPGATPQAPLVDAFGARYQGFAAATLIGGGFALDGLTPARQPLDQPRIDFVWSIQPDGQPGQKTLLASLNGSWEPVSGQGDVIERPLWRASFPVSVTRSFVTTGQLDLMTLLSGMLGSVLSVPWLYERFKSITASRKRRVQKRDRP